MKKFIKRFSGLVKGIINRFDRIVFKSLVLLLMSSSEVMSFCRSRSILNKDYKQWMMTHLIVRGTVNLEYHSSQYGLC